MVVESKNSGLVQRVQRFEYKLEENGYVSARVLIDSVRGYKIKALYQVRHFSDKLTIDVDYRKKKVVINDVVHDFGTIHRAIDEGTVKNFAGIIKTLQAVAEIAGVDIWLDGLVCAQQHHYVSLSEKETNKRMYIRDTFQNGVLQHRSACCDLNDERVATVQFARDASQCRIVYNGKKRLLNATQVHALQALHKLYKSPFRYDELLNLVKKAIELEEDQQIGHA